MNLTIVTPPAAEPITLLDTKPACRIDLDDTSQDAYLNVLISAARRYAEHYTGRAICMQTLMASYPYFTHCIELPRPKLVAIDFVKYTDYDGNEQTVSPSDYQVDTRSTPGRIKPAYNTSWPAVRGYDFDPVRIQYQAGWGVGSPDEVPEDIKLWMFQRVSQWFEIRAPIVTGTIVSTIPRDFVDGLLDPHKQWKF